MSDWPLVGRKAVMQRLSVLLSGDDSSSGVVLAGMPGVGKSRVGTECLGLAAKAGYVTASVTAMQAASTIAFGAFAPMLPSSLPASFRSGGHKEMLQGAALAIAGAGAGRPVALLVDDAHLLDGASATLVHQLALMPSVFVVVAVAMGEHVPDAVTALWKDGVVERLDIAPIGQDDVGHLLVSVLGGPVDAGTLGYLQSRSAGNVLLLRHLVLGALEAHALRNDDGVWRLVRPFAVPSSVVELVEARIAGLGDAERTLLEALAFGEPLGVESLARIGQMTDIEALERRHLVVIRRDGRRLEARLAHRLHGDVLRARSPILRADSVRRALAHAVEVTGAQRRDDLLRIAGWRLEGGSSLSPETALLAARRALTVGDLALAEALSQRAVETGGGFDARLLHGDVLDLQGRVDDAEKELAALEPLAVDEARRVALGLTRIRVVGFRQARVGEALKLSEHVLATVAGESGDELRAIHANLLMSVGDATSAVRLAEPLLATAQGRAVFEACEAAGTGLTRLGRLGDAVEVAARGAAIPEAVLGRPPAWHPAVHVLSQCEALCAAGRALQAERVARENYDRWVAGGYPEAQATSALILARVYLAQGRVGSAVRWTSEHLSLQRQHGSLVLTRWGLLDRAHALALAGRGVDAAATLQEADSLPFPDDGRWWPHHMRARAWTAVARGDVREALSMLRGMAERASGAAEPVPESEALHDLARLGEATSVAGRLEQLATQIEGDLAPARAAHARALANNDARAFRDVATSFEEMGAFLLAAEAATTAAAVRRQPHDNHEAVVDEQWSFALASRCEGAVTPALSTVGAGASLTTREREIATLAAKGLSNRAIADRLKLSVRTVENQLQRVYEKLGVRGRTGLSTVLGSR